MGNAMGNNAAATNYAQTYGGYGGPVAAGNFPAAAGAYPAGAFPAGAYPTTAGAFPAGAYPTTAGAVPSAFFPGTVASPALYGPATAGPFYPTAAAAPIAPAPTKAKKGKGTKENRFLDKEYAERIQAETALAYGNYAGATWHDARADRWGVKADKVHFRGYNKGAMATPYAFHPIAPAAGVAAVQPGVYGSQFSATNMTGTPLYADAVQVGLYGAPAPVAYPSATMLPQAGALALPSTNPFYGF